MNFDADRLKQLTWLAGRKSTPAPWKRQVRISRLGAAATDGYVSGWYRDDHPGIPEGSVLLADAAELRRDIGKGTVDLGQPWPDDKRLLEWLVSTEYKVRQEGNRFRVPDAKGWIKSLNAQKKKGAKRLNIRSRSNRDDLILPTDTTTRALRQYKADGELHLWYSKAIVATQCPATGVYLMWTKIHPDLDPGEGN